jgi:ABC-type multidrug transport system fused ATPase/permease subunit
MSLGSIHVHQRLGEALINSMRQFGRTITFAYQVPFLLAASFSAAEGPESVVPTVDYDDYREARGMHIQVSGLCFAYSKDPVLKNIHLDITPGESLAVVGFNGSGKTTFVKTLLGLHNHTGSLAINGRDIRDYNPESLHRRMSCLFQDYAKYDLRLRDNVGLGDTTRMDQTDLLNTSIERGGATAIRDQYGLDVWLNGSRPGLATNFINDEGIGIVKNRNSMRRTNIIYREGDPEEPEEPASNPADSDDDSDSSVCSDAFITTGLSGGQWQRVALARAFMRADTADLIVFDEPSASLDPRAEAELFDRIHSLAHGSGATTIFISHRFNTVRRADRIAFMDQGVSMSSV